MHICPDVQTAVIEHPKFITRQVDTSDDAQQFTLMTRRLLLNDSQKLKALGVNVFLEVLDETGNEPGTAPGPRLISKSDLPHFFQPQGSVHEKEAVFFGRDLAPATISLEFFQSLGFHCF